MSSWNTCVQKSSYAHFWDEFLFNLNLAKHIIFLVFIYWLIWVESNFDCLFLYSRTLYLIIIFIQFMHNNLSNILNLAYLVNLFIINNTKIQTQLMEYYRALSPRALLNFINFIFHIWVQMRSSITFRCDVFNCNNI